MNPPETRLILADEVERIVHAFPAGDSRRDDVRRLAQRIAVVEAAAAVRGGEWCAENRAAGRGPCGACSWCCLQAVMRAEAAEAELRTCREQLNAMADAVAAEVPDADKTILYLQREKLLNDHEVLRAAARVLAAEVRHDHDDVCAPNRRQTATIGQAPSGPPRCPGPAYGPRTVASARGKYLVFAPGNDAATVCDHCGFPADEHPQKPRVLVLLSCGHEAVRGVDESRSVLVFCGECSREAHEAERAACEVCRALAAVGGGEAGSPP